MPQKTDLNVAPYFDDFDDLKKFLRILFRPGFAVQARELTQLQTLLQNQVERFGQHIFEDGAMVIPGYCTFDTNYTFVKVESDSDLELESYRDEEFLGKTIIGGTSGVQALVVNHSGPDGDDNITFYVKYLKSGTSGVVSTFAAGETISVSGSAVTAEVAATDHVGVGSAASIKDGVYFVRGFFVKVDEQTIILDAEDNTPSYRVGLSVVESIVVPDEDNSLNDNAQGTENFAAPGAHRFKIDLVLTKLELDEIGTEDSENFIELIRLTNGLPEKIVEVTDYSIIEKTLARRTYDESGDYTVRPFQLKVREFYNDTTNFGVYLPADFEYDTQAEARAASQTIFGVADPGTSHNVSGKHRPGSSPSDLVDLMKAKLVLEVDPGKAYVRGYEITKIAKTLINTNKAREYAYENNATIKTPIGNYVRVRKLNQIPVLSTYEKLELRDTPTASIGTAAGNIIGYARVRGIELESGTPGSDSAIYRVYLFDIQMNSGKFFYDTKQLAGATNFTADIALEQKFLTGSITLANGDATVLGNGTRWNTDPAEKLVAGDWIVSNGLLYKIDTITNDNALELSASYGGTTTAGLAFSYVYAQLLGSNNNSLLFPLPQRYIRSIKSDDDLTVDTNYYVRRTFSQAVSGGEATILTAHADEEFVDYSSDAYVVAYEGDVSHGGGAGNILNGGSLTWTPNGTSTQMTIGGLTNGETVRVIATIRKTQGTPSTAKTKSITSTSLSTGSGVQDLNEVSLGKADIIDITAIYMAPDFTTAPTNAHTNVTDRYTLDNGQRDNFYDLGRIVRKPSAPAATGRLLVEFRYFSHGGNGNYFSVDSYTVIAGLEYEDIPSYQSTENGFKYDLRDVLDFRPRINDAGTAFDAVTGSLTELPYDGAVFADFSYYLNRIDKLYLDPAGTFHVSQGVSGLTPSAPEDPAEGMVTHQLNIRAYTLNPEAVVVDFRENKRYTMRDIGKLERRIENLEYYTALSLLEKETQDLEIKDANGLDRFKNGFIVDPFNGHGIGDVQSNEYRCAVDMLSRKMRPTFYESNVKLVEENTTDFQRTSDHYQKTGPIFTLPYEEKSLIAQPLASDAINVNPFAVFTFIGNIVLDPPFDEWKDTERAPDLVVNHEGSFDSISQTVEGMGTIWDEWTTTWVGIPQTSVEVSQQVEIGAPVPVTHRNLDGSVDNTSLASGMVSQPGVDVWPRRGIEVTRTTTTVDTRQSRTGLRARVIPKTITENLGDKVINVAYLPWIRSRTVTFTAKGLKPNTRVYPFFDGVAVTSYVTPNGGSLGGALITDATGSVTGTYTIPNTDTVRFRVGERIFKLTGSSTNGSEFITSASAVYRAQGLLETKQNTILSTRNAEVAWDSLVEDKLITDTSVSESTVLGPWVDPIAQSFLIPTRGGAFITGIKVFFKTKDQNIPITMQIREMVNGYPGPRILPGGEIVKAAADVQTSNTAATATIFTPEFPVYTQEGQEYCFVLLTNCTSYQAWIATLGSPIVGTEIPIEDQPYNGSFFKSQNASTWTADQYTDMKFEVMAAEFDTSTTGVITLTNDEIPTRLLQANPFKTTNGSKKVRVSHRNHGMPNGSYVVFTGAPNTNGIPLAELNTEHQITDADLDSYVITVSTTNATSSGDGGGAVVYATENKAFDVLHPIVGNMILPGTNIRYNLKTTSGKSVDGSQTPYEIDSEFSSIIANSNVEFDSPRLIASARNEEGDVMVNGASKSMVMEVVISSSNSNVSAVVDSSRISVISVGNRLDSPSTTRNVDPIDVTTVVSGNTNIAFTATTNVISSTDPATSKALSQIQKGKYITVSGDSAAANNDTYRVISVTYADPNISIVVDHALATDAAGDSITVKQLEKFIDEKAPDNGSASFKYLSRRMTLAQPATAAKIMFSAYRHASNTFRVFYKASKVDDSTIFDDLDWVEAVVDMDPGVSSNKQDFRDYEYTLDDLDDFVSIAVKIVGLGTDTANVPQFEDLRVLALGT